jgi:hypothetical protein
MPNDEATDTERPDPLQQLRALANLQYSLHVTNATPRERAWGNVLALVEQAQAERDRLRAALQQVQEAVAVFCHGEQAYAEHAHYCVPILTALDGAST